MGVGVEGIRLWELARACVGVVNYSLWTGMCCDFGRFTGGGAQCS